MTTFAPVHGAWHGAWYLAAFVPVEGESMNDQFRSSPEPILLPVELASGHVPMIAAPDALAGVLDAV